jgi:hypothetical protein
MRRVTLEFDETNARDRALLARIYRVAKVLAHEQHGGRIAVEVDVPRRVLAQFIGAPSAAEV